MRISDWSSDVCSSDLLARVGHCFHTHIAVGLQQLGKFIDRNAFAGGEGRHQLTDPEGSHGPLRDGNDCGANQFRLLALLLKRMPPYNTPHHRPEAQERSETRTEVQHAKAAAQTPLTK